MRSRVVDVTVVFLAIRPQGEPEDQFGRCAPGAVLVRAGIERFAVRVERVKKV